MGEMAEYAFELALQELYEWGETVDGYMDGRTDEEIVEDAREVLNSGTTLREVDRNRTIGILSFWRGYQRLTDKQRNALAHFVLLN